MKRLLVLTLLSIGTLLQIQGCGDHPRDFPLPVHRDIDLDSATYPHTQVDSVDMSTLLPYYFKDQPQYLTAVDISSLSLNFFNIPGVPPDSSACFAKIIFTMQFDSSYGNNAEYTLAEFDSVYLYQLYNNEKAFNITNGGAHSVIRYLANHPKMMIRTSFIPTTNSPVLRNWYGVVTLNFKLTVTDSKGWL